MTISVDARDLRSAKSGDYSNELRPLAEAKREEEKEITGTEEEGGEGHESGSPDPG